MMNRIVVLLVLVGVFWSCNNDDSGDIATPDPPRPLSEVLAEDEAEIQEYLKTHYYNYAEFQNPPENFDYKIELQQIPEGNTDTIPLIDQVESKKVTVLGVAEDEADVSHTYYYIVARKGAGQSPTVADSTFIKYEGTLLDNSKFDGTTSFGWQYLPFFLRGYAEGISNLNAGGEIVTNSDGTFSITDTGIGMVIMPSGLAYYNNAQGTIPAYSPLIFTFELGSLIENTDFDNDGIPSILEDVNNDGNLNNDNTDGDFVTQGIPASNHRDPDDDNDGTPTREEIELDAEGNLILPFPDGDNDGTPDHLDVDTK